MIEKELNLTREEAIKAYINKPESEDFYIKAFEQYEVNGIERFKWVWSWWAFAGGIFFLLYRKLYIEALVFFILGIIASKVTFASIILWIASGGVFIYFVYKRYKKIVTTAIDHGIKGDMAIESLNELGGYNKWALNIAIILNVIVMIWFMYSAFILSNNPEMLRDTFGMF